MQFSKKFDPLYIYLKNVRILQNLANDTSVLCNNSKILLSNLLKVHNMWFANYALRSLIVHLHSQRAFDTQMAIFSQKKKNYGKMRYYNLQFLVVWTIVFHKNMILFLEAIKTTKLCRPMLYFVNFNNLNLETCSCN